MDGIATPVTLLECRAAGVAAFEAGQSTSDCPHNPYTEEYGAWQRGFGTARYGATQPESIQLIVEARLFSPGNARIECTGLALRFDVLKRQSGQPSFGWGVGTSSRGLVVFTGPVAWFINFGRSVF